MSRKRPLILPLLTALFLFTATGSSQVGTTAQTRKVFGPEQFTRTTGATDIYTHTFTVPSYVAAPYTLRVQNGKKDGTDRITDAISSGTVAINGTEIIHKSDFNQNVATITRAVSLQSENTLTLTLNSAPDSFITVTISGIINIGHLNQLRSGHTATLQADGSILITGGQNSSGPLSSAERFDPLTLTFSPLDDSLDAARLEHAASVLADETHLLVAGQGAGGVLASAELFDPATGLFSNLSDIIRIPRSGHSATVLPDGRVLIVGGHGSPALGSAEAFDAQDAILFKPPYDPQAGTFILLPNALSSPRWDHTATLLPDGRVLVIGGRNDSGYLSSAELFDPATETFSQLSTLNSQLSTPRSGHTATLMPDGRVLILGGQSDSGYLATAEAFDPATETFSPLSTFNFQLSTPRANHTATLLYFGEILITGGENSAGVLDNAELYGPPPVDSTAPAIVQVTPQDGATGVDLTEIVGVRFSEPVDVTTLHSGSLYLTGSGTVDSIISPSEQGLLVFLVPKANLSAGTTYTLHLTSDITDTAGNPLTPFTSTFTTVASPVITSVTPDHRPVGTAVTITGEHFDSSAPSLNVVKFADVEAVVTAATATQLETSVPFDVPVGPGSLAVTTRGGTSSATFTVENPVPALQGLSPDSVLAGSSAFTLTLSGSNFIASSLVNFGNTVLTPTLIDGTELQVSIPGSAITTPGAVQVTVFNPAPGGGSSNFLPFILNNPAPSITTLSPTQVVPGGGAFTLTVNGTNFLTTSIVQMDGQGLTTTFVNGTQLLAEVPSSAIATARIAQVTVVNPAPGGVSNAAELIINTPPVADAGRNLSAATGKMVHLDGRKSRDDDGDLITFSWSLLSAPAGSEAFLENPIGVRPSLTPDIAGSYQIQLIVNDGKMDSAPATVTVTAATPNAAPNADAGPDQTAIVRQFVTLDGRYSSDPEDSRITYQWSLVSAPVPIGGRGGTGIVNPTSVLASLYVPAAGEYVVQLVVNDGVQGSAPVQMKVTAYSPNAAPMARAGRDKNVLTGTTIILDGSKSRDPNSSLLSYHWFFVSIPANSAVTLTDSTTVAPTFVPDISGDYLIRLVVNDGAQDSAPDTVLIQAALPNPGPNAHAGGDETAYQYDTVTLDGSGSFDPNGNPLTYHWTIVSAPSGSLAALSDPMSAQPTFAADLGGLYVIGLTVSDGTNSSISDVVIVQAHRFSFFLIGPANPAIAIGQAIQFTTTGYYYDSSFHQISRDLTSLVAWTNSNTTVATINSSGMAVGLKAGTTQIAATYKGITSPAQTLYVNNPVPSLTALSPNSAMIGSGSFTLTVYGTNFVPSTYVLFKDASLVTTQLTATYVNSTQLEASVPASLITTVGTASVYVFNPSPGGGTSNTLNFEIRNPAPSISAISPTQWLADSPVFLLTVEGTNFMVGSTVYLGSTPLPTAYQSPTKLTVTLDFSIPYQTSLMPASGQYPVTVVNPAPGGGASNALEFTVLSNAPEIHAVSPNQLSQGSVHRKVTITGSRIRPGASVQIGGTGITLHSTTGEATYTVSDSRSGGPPFYWRHAAYGQPVLSNCDNCVWEPFTLDYLSYIGFPLTLFGQPVTSLWINSNGLLSFEDSSNDPNNSAIPSASPPNLFLAPFWDDLLGGSVYLQIQGSPPNRILIIQWNHVSTCCEASASDLTFEILLFEKTQQIVFQYLTLSGVNADGRGATVGIEGSDGLKGVSYLVDGVPAEHLLTEGRAITFTPIVPALTLDISVAEDAPLGPRNLIITNPDGTSTTVAGAITIVPIPIALSITSPIPGSINQATVMVQGTVSAKSGEVGVVVNGIMAHVNGNRFVANDVPLELGTNTLTATATDFEGNNLTKSVTVTANELLNPVDLLANPVSGVAPLLVEFSIRPNVNATITGYTLDVNGDGTVDLTDTVIPETIPFTYTEPGLYLAIATLIDEQGTTYTDTLAINVLSIQKLDALLQSKWEGMKTALLNGDIETALTYFVEDSHERYRGIFTALGTHLPEIATDMQSIQFIYMKNGLAKYRLVREEEAGLITYYIHFQLDESGIWRIRQF